MLKTVGGLGEKGRKQNPPKIQKTKTVGQKESLVIIDPFSGDLMESLA